MAWQQEDNDGKDNQRPTSWAQGFRRRFGPIEERVRRYFGVLTDRRQPIWRRIRYASGVVMGIAAGLLLLVALYAILLIPFTPGISTLSKSKVERPSVVLSENGEEITRFRRVNREWVSLEGISEHVIDALIATEDHRFYRHPGVDPIRIAGAFLATLGGSRQGGSTITQQLARNMFPDEIGRTISMRRKLKELITALKIELAFTKDEILEAYLNTVPFYYGAYGIEMAARTYFGKSASDLEVAESATLVGMLKGTYYYNPVRNPERALQRRNVALSQMVKRGYLLQAEFDDMRDDAIRLNFERQEQETSKSPHFTEHLRMWLSDWADRRGYNIYRDSLIIHTTLNMDLQRMAERAVQRQGDALQAVADVEWSRASSRLVARHPSTYLGYRRGIRPFEHLWASRPELVESFVRRTSAFSQGVTSGLSEDEMLDSLLSMPAFLDSLLRTKTRLEVGLVALEPATGHVRAWVGSRNFESDQYDHVARARRQPGSTFKPFVYARALQEGYLPSDKIEDRPVEIPMEGEYVWRPRNAGETVSGREMSLREGLVYSKNTITAQLVDDIGARDVTRLARRMGVNRSTLRAVPSIALGTSEVSLLEMVSAYGTFASVGTYTEPVLVTRIVDREGEVLEEFVPRSRRVLPKSTASAIVDMMRGVVDQGTATRIRTTFGIRQDVAGKTGTTQNSADGWFIMMHPNLVVGSWVGFNDPRITFRSDYWGQGGNNALFVVGDFFRQVVQNGALAEPSARLPEPPDIEERPSLISRAANWIRDLFVSAWEALFGDSDEEQPRQGDTYVADQVDGAVRIDDSEEGSETMADSLTRMERRSNRLDSLIQELGARPNAPSDDTPASDESSSEPPEAPESTEPEDQNSPNAADTIAVPSNSGSEDAPVDTSNATVPE